MSKLRTISRMVISVLAAGILFAGCTENKEAETTEEKNETMNVQVDTVKTDEFTMDYCRFGNGKKVFVAIPGLSVQSIMPSAEAIAEAYKVMADEYTLYFFDRRKDHPDTYSIDDMAKDTAAAVRALGIEQADFFGASQGGMIALKIAINDPELVHKLILGSSSACVAKEQYQKIGEWVGLAKAGDAKGLYLSFGEAVYPAEVYENSKEMLESAAATVTKEELESFAVIAEAADGFDVSDQLGTITQPVLVIGSEDDRVLGGDASRKIAEGLKNSSHCELYMYDGYGHAVYDLAPDYKERMLKFLLAEE